VLDLTTFTVLFKGSDLDVPTHTHRQNERYTFDSTNNVDHSVGNNVCMICG